MSSALKLRASHTRDALLHVPHTRAAIERELPRTRAVFKRAQLLTDWSRKLLTRLSNKLTELTDQLHLPRLSSKRTA